MKAQTKLKTTLQRKRVQRCRQLKVIGKLFILHFHVFIFSEINTLLSALPNKEWEFSYNKGQKDKRKAKGKGGGTKNKSKGKGQKALHKNSITGVTFCLQSSENIVKRAYKSQFWSQILILNNIGVFF